MTRPDDLSGSCEIIALGNMPQMRRQFREAVKRRIQTPAKVGLRRSAEGFEMYIEVPPPHLHRTRDTVRRTFPRGYFGRTIHVEGVIP